MPPDDCKCLLQGSILAFKPYDFLFKIGDPRVVTWRTFVCKAEQPIGRNAERTTDLAYHRGIRFNSVRLITSPCLLVLSYAFSCIKLSHSLAKLNHSF